MNAPNPTDVARWLQADAAKQVVVLASAALDQRDWEGFVQHLAPDVQLTRPDGQCLQGRDAVLQAYRQRDPHRLTRHLIVNQAAQWVADDTLQVHSTVLLWTADERSPTTPRGRPAHALQLLGSHEDVIQWRQGAWQIAQRRSRFDMYHDFSAGPPASST